MCESLLGFSHVQLPALELVGHSAGSADIVYKIASGDLGVCGLCGERNMSW